MSKKYRTANWKSIGFTTTVSLTMVLSFLTYYGAYNAYRNVGLTTVFFIVFGLASIAPIMWTVHSLSFVLISGNTITKKSVFRTRTYDISDYKSVHITSTVASNLPSATVLTADEAKHESWKDYWTVRHIVLSKKLEFNPYDVTNLSAKTVNLPYYQDLYDTIEKQINTDPNKS